MSVLVRTRTELRTRIRNRSDKTNSTSVSDAELDEMINAAYAELLDEVYDAADTEARVHSHDDVTVAATDVYTLAATGGPGGENDIYRVAGVDVQFQGDWLPIRKFKFSDRGRLVNVNGWTGAGDTFYRLHGRDQSTGAQKIRFFPTPAAVHSFRVWYLPISPEVDGTVPLVALNGWDEFIVCDVCAMIFDKEEGKAAPFLKRRDRALGRVKWAAANLDESGTDGIRETVDWGEPNLRDYEPLV